MADGRNLHRLTSITGVDLARNADYSARCSSRTSADEVSDIMTPCFARDLSQVRRSKPQRVAFSMTRQLTSTDMFISLIAATDISANVSTAETSG